MNNPPIIIERTYHAPIEMVWKALTDVDEMRKWYFDFAEFRPEVGFEFEFLAGSSTKKYLHKCKILEVVKGKKLSYSWQYDGYDGNSQVTFELKAEGDKTHLTLTHAGIETFPGDIYPDFAKSSFNNGWSYFVNEKLLAYLEG